MLIKGKSLYLIDFGLSRKVIDDGTESKQFVGNFMFCSVNRHQYKTVSFLDDLESVLYLIMYLEKRTLPWQFIRVGNPKVQSYQILRRKMRVNFKTIKNNYSKFLKKYYKKIKSKSFERESFWDELIDIFK